MKTVLDTLPQTEKMPVLFVGHGSPMNAIEINEYSNAWEKIATEIPRPNVILAISAHWYARGTMVHGSEHPKTIHDFYGFPRELYKESYPAVGSPVYARATKELLMKANVGWDLDWGLDHGTWVVTKCMYPQADIPVFQLSIDFTKPGQYHFDIGTKLQELRNRGVLILASGNIVHNLNLINFEESAKPFEWAQEFDEISSKLIDSREYQKLIDYQSLGQSAKLSIPTPDHYFPLLYALGAQQKDEEISTFVSGIEYGSISMRSLRIG